MTVDILTWHRLIVATPGVELLEIAQFHAFPRLRWRDGGVWGGADRSFIARPTVSTFYGGEPRACVSMRVGAQPAFNRTGARVQNEIDVSDLTPAVVWKQILREAKILSIGG